METIKTIMSKDKENFYVAVGQWELLNNEVMQLNEQNNSLAVVVNGENCKTVDALLNEFKIRFNFPEYFGYNFAALDECLNDLEWFNHPSYLVIIKDFECLLINEDDALEDFMMLLTNAVKEWNKGRNYDDFRTPPTPFKVILHVEKEIEWNKKRIENIGLEDLKYIYLDC